MVVLSADKNHGQLPQRAHIRLSARNAPLLTAPSPKATDRHVVGLLHLHGERDARGDGDARAHDADSSHDANVRLEQVHGAALAAGSIPSCARTLPRPFRSCPCLWQNCSGHGRDGCWSGSRCGTDGRTRPRRWLPVLRRGARRTAPCRSCKRWPICIGFADAQHGVEQPYFVALSMIDVSWSLCAQHGAHSLPRRARGWGTRNLP